jgi:hypothetical protein
MFKGRYVLGDRVPLSAWTRDSALTPTLPGDVPLAEVWSSTVKVLEQKLPVSDRYGITARFGFRLHLDGRFAVGRYHVVYRFTVGGSHFKECDEFDIVAGGHADGTGISMTFVRHPTSDFVLMQVDAGRVLRLRNPRI